MGSYENKLARYENYIRIVLSYRIRSEAISGNINF